MKIDRLIGMLSVLLQKDKVTAAYLAEKFEVSKRTVIRDIDTLSRAGIPIVTEQGKNGGISVMNGYAVDKTLLTPSELNAILAGLKSLDSVSGDKRYSLLMEKLSVDSSDFLSGNQNILIDLSSWSKAQISPKIEFILKAIDNSLTVSFNYFSPRRESFRTVEPYYLLFRWSSWYLWAYCLEKSDFRLFKLNRMTNLFNGTPFEKREAPLPDLSQENIFPHIYNVKALFPSEFKWRLVEEYGEDCFSETEDGKLLFSFGFTDKESILCWILTFGASAELLEPAEFRKDMLEIGKEFIKKYKD